MSINTHNSRILHSFDYYSPTTVNEAIKLLQKYGGSAGVLAGGTDLIPKMKQGLVRPSHIVNLKKIPGLEGVHEDDGWIEIGALTRLRDIELSKLIKTEVRLLHSAISSIGSIQIRNMATVGGNLCNSSPAADSAQALIALDAKANIAGSKGTRAMDVENFFRGPGKNALSKDELLTSIVIPKIKGNAASFFIKVGRTSLDLATVSIATQAYFKKNMVEDIRVVLGAVAPTPLRLRDCENHIKGHRLEPKIISEAAEIVSKNIHPITDVRGSLEYRRSTARGLTLAALESISKEIRRSTD